MECNIKIKLQSLEWFNENCFKDPEGDWWMSEELYNTYESEGAVESVSNYLYINDSKGTNHERSFGAVVDVDIEDFKHWSWAVEYYLTKETHPEYFL